MSRIKFLEEFKTGEALQEVKEKTSCTDAKTIEKSTEGLHQAQYSLKFKVWCQVRIEQQHFMDFYGFLFLAISFVYLMFLQSCLFVIAFGQLLLQALAEVQKQMGFFDAELKDSKRRAEEMQQAPSFFVFVFNGVRLCTF